jgi:hypothetical protein
MTPTPFFRHCSLNGTCYVINVDPIGELLPTSRSCLTGEVLKAVFEFTAWSMESAKAKNADSTCWLIDRLQESFTVHQDSAMTIAGIGGG